MPPNFLVGSGATDYAYEHGLVVLPDDGLVSESARERWARWQHDLQVAELTERQQNPARYQAERVKAYFRRAAPNPAHLRNGLPGLGDSLQSDQGSSSDTSFDAARSQEAQSSTSPVNQDWSPKESNGLGNSIKYTDGAPPQVAPSPIASDLTDSAIDISNTDPKSKEDVKDNTGDSYKTGSSTTDISLRADQISDTVGAIAVDCHGNIAAGSSSGGIGMKHRGRIGPAALVGIGTAVIPIDPNDPDKTCVASVTSGTGEHIATAMAANTCASRVYYTERKGADGAFEEVTEEAAMRAMIDNDFMGKICFFYCAASRRLIFVRSSWCAVKPLSRCHWNSDGQEDSSRGLSLLRP